MSQPRVTNNDASSAFIQKMITDQTFENAAAAASGEGGVNDAAEGKPAAGAGKGKSAKGGEGAKTMGAGAAAPAMLPPAPRSTNSSVSPDMLPPGGAESGGQSVADVSHLDDASGLGGQYATDTTLKQLDVDTTTLSESLQDGLPSDASLKQNLSAFSESMTAAGRGKELGGAVRDLLDNGTIQGKDLTHAINVAKSIGIDVDTSTDAPDVDKANSQLSTALKIEPTDLTAISLGTAHVARAMRADGASPTDIHDQVKSLATGAGVSDSAGAAALVAALRMGGQIPGESTASATAGAQARQVQAQAAKEGQKQYQAQQLAAAQQAAQAQYGGGGGGNPGGGTSGATGGSGGSSTGLIDAPNGTASASATAYGTQVPWSSFHQEAYPPGRFNGEEQRYTNDGSNVTNNPDGSLTITAKHDSSGWSSARLVGETIGQVPVYMNFNASMKSSAGGWPALWLTDTKNPWPSGGGEVDVTEQVNGEGINHISTHVGDTEANKADTHEQVALPGGGSATHDYGVYITNQGVQFYQDGKPVGSFVNMREKYPNWNPATLAPVMNYAIGGNMPQKSPTSTEDQSLTINGVTRSTTPPDGEK